MLGDSHKKSEAADTEFSDNRTSRSIHLAERYSNGILINMCWLKRHFNNAKKTALKVRFVFLRLHEVSFWHRIGATPRKT